MSEVGGPAACLNYECSYIVYRWHAIKRQVRHASDEQAPALEQKSPLAASYIIYYSIARLRIFGPAAACHSPVSETRTSNLSDPFAAEHYAADWVHIHDQATSSLHRHSGIFRLYKTQQNNISE